MYSYGRITLSKSQAKGYALMSVGVGLFGCLAILSKENGILMVLYILVTELTLFRNIEKQRFFKHWFSLFIGLPIALLLGYFASRGFFYSSYGLREFTLYERLLTESRILVNYVYNIFIPPIGGTGLIHDDIKLSTSLFNPISTFFSIILNTTLIVLAIRFRKQYAVFSFSVLWFYSGHLIESTFIPLELYFEHRNYLPMLGPIYGMFFYLNYFYSRTSHTGLKRSLATAPILLILFSLFVTSQSTKIWSDPSALFATWAHEHPDSLRAQRIYGQYLHITGQPRKAIAKLEKTYSQYPYDISIPLEIINVACTHNLASPYHLNDISSLVEKSKYTGGFWVIVKTFIDNVVRNRCGKYSVEEMIELLSTLSKIPDIKRHKPVYAKMLFLKSDLYVLKRRLSPAIMLLDEAYRYQPTVTIRLRQAKLLESAKLYQDALKYIELAKQADSARKRTLKPSNLVDILELEEAIKNSMAQHVKLQKL
jgi:tetratricopeptide (TPR) repeat protein